MLKQIACKNPSLKAAMNSIALILGPPHNPSGVKRPHIADVSVTATGEVEGPRLVNGVARKPDPLVAQIDEVPHCQLATVDIVNPNAGDPLRHGVDQHHGRPRLLQGQHLILTRGQRHDQHPVGAVVTRDVADARIASGDRLHIKDHQAIAADRKLGFNTAQPLNHRRAGEERGDSRDGEGFARGEATGDLAWGIAKLGDRSEDTIARDRADQGAVIQHS